MKCDICGSERQELLQVEVPRGTHMPEAVAQVCPRCLTYELLLALTGGAAYPAARDLKPVA